MALINFGYLDPNFPANTAAAPLNSFLSTKKTLADLQSQEQEGPRKMRLADLTIAAQEGALGDAQRAREDLAAQRQIYATGGGDMAKTAQGLISGGYGKEGLSLLEQQRKAQGEQLKNLETMKKVKKFYAQQVLSAPSEQTAMMALQGFARDTGTDQSEQIAMIRSFGGDVEKIRQWAAGHAMDADKLLPQNFERNLGNRTEVGRRDPVTGQTIGNTQSLVRAPEGYVVGPDGSLAIDQGYLAGKKQIAAAGAPRVNVGAPVLEREEFKEKGKENVKLYAAVRDQANVARRLNAQLDSMGRILDSGFDTGFATPQKAAVANFFASLGSKDAAKYATDAQTFNAAAKEVVLAKQLAQKGPQTESDAKRLEETGAQLTNVKEANRYILDVAKAMNNRDIKQQKFMDDYWRKNKTYEGTEDAWYSGEGGQSLFDSPELAKYSKKATDIPSARGKQVTRTGTHNGRKVVQYSDGTVEYAD